MSLFEFKHRPGKLNLKHMLTDLFELNAVDEVICKQWLTTHRSTPVLVTLSTVYNDIVSTKTNHICSYYFSDGSSAQDKKWKEYHESVFPWEGYVCHC
jgi:hypothetical protein